MVNCGHTGTREPEAKRSIDCVGFLLLASPAPRPQPVGEASCRRPVRAGLVVRTES